MNSKILIIAIAIIFRLINPLAAQPNIKDSTEAYEYWAQRGIIEMFFAFMNDYIEAVGEPNAQKEIEGKDKYEQQYISNIGNEKLPEFEIISTFLKDNNWKGYEKKVFQPLWQNLKKSVELDSSFFEAKKPGSDDVVTNIPGKTNKRVNWEKKSKEIITYYTDALVNLSKKDMKSQEELEVQVIPDVDDKKEPRNQFSNSIPDWIKKISYPLLFILGMLIGGGLIFFISKHRIYSILKVEKDSYLYDLKLMNEQFIFKYLGLIYILWQRKESYKTENSKRDIKTLQDTFVNQIEELEKENLDLNQTILDNTIQITDPKSFDKIKSNVLEIKQPERKTKKLFFTMPENDGRFIIENGETSNEGRKYFRIEYQDASELGELYFISSERDKRAINRLESYLKPVCEIENIANADKANRVEFLRSGKVVLINDSWVIDTDNKAKVKLI